MALLRGYSMGYTSFLLYDKHYFPKKQEEHDGVVTVHIISNFKNHPLIYHHYLSTQTYIHFLFLINF